MLRIPQPIYEAMLDHLQSAHPLEGCGILGGPPGVARRFYPIENVLHSATAYEMAPAQQLQVMLSLEAAGWSLVGLVHSHPAGPQRPSPSDIAQAHYPQTPYLIVSLADRARPVVRAFYIDNGRVTEIPLLIE